MDTNTGKQLKDGATETGMNDRLQALIEEAAREEKSGSHDAAMLAVTRAMELAAKNAAEHDPEMNRLLNRRRQVENNCDWHEVIEVQKEIIRYSEEERPRQHPEAPPHYAPGIACKPWLRLASIYSILGDGKAALEAADRAVAYARQSDLGPLISQSLADRAEFLILFGSVEAAHASAREALAAMDPELPFTEDLLARYQILLARCQALTNDTVAAWQGLQRVEAAWECRQCQPVALRAGWLEVRAEIAIVEGRVEDAVVDLQRAVGFWQVAARKFMGGESYAAIHGVRALRRLHALQKQVGRTSEATNTRLQIETLCEQYRYPLTIHL